MVDRFKILLKISLRYYISDPYASGNRSLKCAIYAHIVKDMEKNVQFFNKQHRVYFQCVLVLYFVHGIDTKRQHFKERLGSRCYKYAVYDKTTCQA